MEDKFVRKIDKFVRYACLTDQTVPFYVQIYFRILFYSAVVTASQTYAGHFQIITWFMILFNLFSFYS